MGFPRLLLKEAEARVDRLSGTLLAAPVSSCLIPLATAYCYVLESTEVLSRGLKMIESCKIWKRQISCGTGQEPPASATSVAIIITRLAFSQP